MASVRTLPPLDIALIQPDVLLNSGALSVLALLTVAAVIAFLFPNSNEVCAAIEAGVKSYETVYYSPLLFVAAMSYGLLFGVAIAGMGRATQFLYFQF